MSPIDPVYDQNFGWIPSPIPPELMVDPAFAVQVRDSFQTDLSYVPPPVATRETRIDGPQGPGSLRLRIYTPHDNSKRREALIWVHGGGWIQGTIDEPETDWVARELVVRAGVTVITPDYAVADGTTVTYPSLHRESLAALDWTIDNAVALGVDADRVTLGGFSAGANLVAGAILEARDTGKRLPAAVLLAYPSLHRKVLPENESWPEIKGVPEVLRFGPENLGYLYSMYTGPNAAEATYASIEGHSLEGLPPMLVMIDEYDDLRESGRVFVEGVRAAGGTVSSYLAKGMAHGHLALTPTFEETDRSLDIIARFLTQDQGTFTLGPESDSTK